MPTQTNKLPDSSQEITSLAFVGAIAILAALARILYGKDDLTWRYTIASMLVAMVTAILIYGLIASNYPQIGGYAGASIGAAVGLFTDDFLKRARQQVRKMKLPGSDVGGP